MAHGRFHEHGAGAATDGRLAAAAAVNALLTVGQLVGGALSGSLSLVADALHNLSDAGALGLALLARRVARRPADRRRTFGYRRAELIGALINLTALVLIGLYLIYEAIWRLIEPRPIAGWLVVAVAAGALVVDAATAALTYRASRGSVNIRAAFVHHVADALGSLGVIASGIVVAVLGWVWADAAVTLALSGYMLWQGGSMMRSTIRVLMDSVPQDLSLGEVVVAMQSVPGVRDVHHVHVWELDEHHRALEAHVVIGEDRLERFEPIKAALKTLLRERFGVGHATLELELPTAGEHAEGVVVEH